MNSVLTPPVLHHRQTERSTTSQGHSHRTLSLSVIILSQMSNKQLGTALVRRPYLGSPVQTHNISSHLWPFAQAVPLAWNALLLPSLPNLCSPFGVQLKPNFLLADVTNPQMLPDKVSSPSLMIWAPVCYSLCSLTACEGL